MFLVQFINTGIIILLVNADLQIEFLPNNFPILKGDYADFTIEWYRVVGTTIVLTMILNVFSPHFSNFCWMIFRGCKRCRDRGCSWDMRRTKKILQVDYENVYLGPEFLMEMRYSQILSNIYIVFTYSGGLPLLYVVAFLSFFATYWVDKFLCNLAQF